MKRIINMEHGLTTSNWSCVDASVDGYNRCLSVCGPNRTSTFPNAVFEITFAVASIIRYENGNLEKNLVGL